MNTENFYKVLKILGILFLFSFIYGLISFELLPIYQIVESTQRFTLEGLVTGQAFLFLNIILFIMFLLEPKKIIAFVSTSFIINIIISKIISHDYEWFYSINMASLTAISAFIVAYIKNKEKRELYNYGFFLGFISLCFGYLVITTLSFMRYILPNVYDTKAVFIDSFYHIPKDSNNIFYSFLQYFPEKSILYQVFFYVYNLLSPAIFLLAFWEYQNNKNRYFVNTLSSLSLLFMIGATSYMLFPIMGPKYLQLSINSDYYNYYTFLNNNLTNSIYPRNGMPSLHFALSLFLMINSYKLPNPKRLVFILFFILTASATIILKEHYIIDWIGALPFVTLTVLSNDNNLSKDLKKSLFLLTIINIIIWYLFLWFGISANQTLFNCIDCSNFNLGMTSMLYILTMLTIGISIYSYKKIYNTNNILNNYTNVNISEEIGKVKNNILNLFNTDKKQLSILFVLSGFAGLMYQVVFGKMLGTIFGSTSIAICIILATYMIGLSIGAWLGSKNETSIPPIIKYALCEGLIAVYCVLTPVIFMLISEIYFSLAKFNLENVLYLNSLKIALGILGLIIPTILMGMTTPILLKEFNEQSEGVSVAKLYTLNTLGAAIGALLSGYLIIQILGVKNTIYLTVLINLLICAFAINMFKKKNSDTLLNQYIKDFFHEFHLMFKSKKSNINKNYEFYISSVILFISGILTMVMETVYTHSLSVVVGNSTYVFSIMLFTFLLGLTIGGTIGKKIIQDLKDNFKILSILECLLGLSITLSYFLIDLVPNYFASFANSITMSSFESRELLRFGVCFFIMILPTIFTGMIYTISLNALSLSQKENNNVIGYGLSINTIGNILGVFLGSFYFINNLQINGSFKVLTLCALIMSVIINLKSLKENKKLLTLLTTLIIVTILNPYKINMNEVTSGNNVYFVNSSRGEVIEYKDNADGGLTSVNKTIVENKPMLTLLTNGKFQGNDNAESVAQGGFAIAPMLHISNKNEALVIGYGTGMTTKAIYDANFKNIDVIDLSPDILNLADKYFSSINGKVRSHNNVKTYITDGRNYLHLTDKKYDLISMEISSIWFAGASYLYNKEFYETAKNKLTKNGVLQQWVQLHHMNPNDFYVILNTLRNQFKYVNFYYIGHQGILVATNSEENKDIKPLNINELNKNKNLNNIRSYYENDFNSIARYRILNSEEIDKMLLSIYGKNVNYFISTDDNLYLEYKTPKGNVLKIDTENIIINNLLKYKNK